MKSTFQKILHWITSFFQFFEQQVDHAWWVRITTENPEYTYYFGPFNSRAAAQDKLPGYVADLRGEKAQVSNCTVEWCTPPQLTIPGSHPPVRLLSDIPS